MTPPAESKPPSKTSKPILPSNAKPMAQWNREQLQKTAESRGIPLAKLIAQMVEQYMKEENEGKAPRVLPVAEKPKTLDHSKEPLDF